MMIRKLYVVLPYLTTSNPMEIRGVVFRSSRDIDFFEDEVKDTFTKIFNMFYLKDDYKIDEMAYAYFEYQNDIELKNILDDLVKIKILLSFLYSSPHPSNLSTGLKDEHAQMYLFYPMKISSTYTYEDYNVIYTGIGSPPKDTGIHDNIDGFHYSINDETDCYISMESKIYPTSRKMYLNIPQDLNNELIRLSFSENPIVSMLLTNESFFQNDNRIFTAIKWYNSTNSFSYNEDMNIIHLAIAFESLFCIPKDEKIKETLITHFRLLLGEIDHIESWVTQFYNARSSLVHEGKIIDYNYWYRNEDTRTIVPYRSLV